MDTNASDALIMAGEILIAILVLTLIVTVNVLFGSFSRNLNEEMAKSKDAAFNAHFYNYMNRANISSSEVASIINYAKLKNDENGYTRVSPTDLSANISAPYYINVYINDVSFFYKSKSDDFYNDFIDNDQDYEETARFKDKVNRFISNKKQYAFCCNVNRIKMPTDEGDKKIILSCNGEQNSAVKIIDENHEQAKKDLGNIRVVSIKFYTVDKIAPVGEKYDITTSNEYEYEIQ